MRVFRVKGTDDTPEITLDKESGVFSISGRSIPENVMDFYNPVLDWLTSYAEEPLEETVFEFRMLYYNTASSKFLLEVLLKLEDIYRNGHKVLVKWHYPHNDGDIEDGGKDFFEIVKIPHEEIAYKISNDADEQAKLLLQSQNSQSTENKENSEGKEPVEKSETGLRCPYCEGTSIGLTFGTRLKKMFGMNAVPTYKCSSCGGTWEAK